MKRPDLNLGGSYYQNPAASDLKEELRARSKKSGSNRQVLRKGKRSNGSKCKKLSIYIHVGYLENLESLDHESRGRKHLPQYMGGEKRPGGE